MDDRAGGGGGGTGSIPAALFSAIICVALERRMLMWYQSVVDTSTGSKAVAAVKHEEGAGAEEGATAKGPAAAREDIGREELLRGRARALACDSAVAEADFVNLL